MNKKLETALFIGIIAILGFILIFYKNSVKDGSDFKTTSNEYYELNMPYNNSTELNNQPQKIGSVSVKSGETNRLDIQGS